MSPSYFLTKLISAILLPPFSLLLLGLTGLMFLRSRPRLGRRLMVTAFVLLWVCATPIITASALRLLEGPPVVLDVKAQQADAIVVLGGGTYFNAPEYGGDTVSDSSLARLRYAAKLQKETGLPVLATGGKPLGNEVSEAQQMKAVLEQDFNVSVRWTEDASDNTWQNAQNCYRILQAAGIHRVYLVTHAWHMPRASLAFRQAGFEVVPAPTAFTTHYSISLLSFLPNASALADSGTFVHECIGTLWYLLKQIV